MLDSMGPCVDDWRGELQARVAAVNAAYPEMAIRHIFDKPHHNTH